MKSVDRGELRSDFEFVLERGNRKDNESLGRVLSGCKWDIMLRDNGFKLKRDGAVTTIIPPKKPNAIARAMLKSMIEHRNKIVRRVFGPVPTVART